jgi:uncharacterized protein YecE (DUF72 family)
MQLFENDFYVGTSGYKYEDWKGVFYPELEHNYQMLEYYATKFDFLEITFTFYKMPLKETLKSLSFRVHKNFLFSIRLTKKFLKGRYSAKDITEFKNGIEPLKNENKLGAIFADFNYDFTAKKSNLDLLINLKSHFTDTPFFVSLPNRTWYKERFIEDLKNNEIGLIINDMPKIKGLSPYYPISTNLYTYFRFYGRNKLWLTPEYPVIDYDYTDEEMETFIKDAIKLNILNKKTFFSFCNVTNGNAPKNALKFAKLLNNFNKKQKNR